MIKFFRKIRYDHMEKNKSTKYFKYAIGEIILVVIGILIALQINNWNEEKKSIQNGQEILSDIKENLEYNTIRFQKDNKVTHEVIKSIDIIYNNITVTKIYNDSLAKHFRRLTWWETSRWKSSGYEAIITHGTKTIQSKGLREAIIDLYEISYPEIAENTRLSEGNFFAILPNWLQLMEKEPSDFNTTLEHKARPFDYQEIINSRMFRSALTWFRSNRLVDIRLRNSSIEKNQELTELIEKELKK